jgi:uncharacterized protein (DUF934 family)
MSKLLNKDGHELELSAAQITLRGDTDPHSLGTLGHDWAQIGSVAIEFPRFTDGRGYSLAKLLRERHGYEGELRAVGDILVDQVFFLARCGFNTFELRQDQAVVDAQVALRAFNMVYQPRVREFSL